MVSLHSLVAGIASVALIAAPVMARVQAPGIQQAFSAINTKLGDIVSTSQKLGLDDAPLSLDGPGLVSELIEGYASLGKVVSHANSLIINQRSRASSEDSLAVRVTNVFCDFVQVNGILAETLGDKASFFKKLKATMAAQQLLDAFKRLNENQYEELVHETRQFVKMHTAPGKETSDFDKCAKRLESDMENLIETYQEAAQPSV